MTGAGHAVSADSVTVSYDVAGVRVIQRPSYANDVVAVDLYLIGGVQEVTATTTGIEALALFAAEYGTARYPDSASRFALAATGSRIVVDPERDWTLFGFRGVVETFDSTWAVFANRVTQPTLDPRSVALVRSQLMREARDRRDVPDSAVVSAADSLSFMGHPYELEPAGTLQSLPMLTSAVVRQFVATQFVTSRMLVVIVGNVPRQRVEHDIAATLGRLPHGAYVWRGPPAPARRATSVAIVPRALSTNYLLGYFHGPAVTSPDYAAFEIATGLLSTRLHEVIRLDRGLSYAAYVQYQGDAIAQGGVYVTTDSPAVVLPLVRDEIERRREQWVSSTLLHRFIEWYITQYLMQNETNESQAASLARAQIYLGNYRQASQRMAALRQVTAGDVLRVSRKYMHDIPFAYLGDPERLRGVRVNGI
jgi:zinc protease